MTSSLNRKFISLLAGSGLIQLAGILNFTVLARALEVDEFSLIRQLLLLNQLIFSISISAIPISMLYFIGKSHIKNKLSIIYQHIVFVLVIGVLLALILNMLSPKISTWLNNPLIETQLPLFSIFPLCYAIYSLAPVIISQVSDNKLLIYNSIIISAINILPSLAIFFNAGYQNIVILYIVSGGLSLLFSISVYMKVGIFDKKNRAYPVQLSSMLVYLSGLLLATGISIIGIKTDHLLISNILGTEKYAIYAVAAFEIPIYALVLSSLNTILLPKVTQYASKQDWNAIKNAWTENVYKSSKIILPISLIVFVFSDKFILFLFGEKYVEAHYVMSIFALMAPIRVCSFGLILRAMGKTYYDLISALIFILLAISSSYIGINSHGLMGGAIGITLSVYILAAINSIFVWKETNKNIGFFDLLPLKIIFLFIIGGALLSIVRFMLKI